MTEVKAVYLQQPAVCDHDDIGGELHVLVVEDQLAPWK